MIREDIYNKMVFIKIKNFYSTKVEKWEDRPQTVRKHFQEIFDKELVHIIYKELLKLKDTNSLLNNWAKILSRYLTKEHILIADKSTTRCSYIIKEMQIKTMRYLPLHTY